MSAIQQMLAAGGGSRTFRITPAAQEGSGVYTYTYLGGAANTVTLTSGYFELVLPGSTTAAEINVFYDRAQYTVPATWSSLRTLSASYPVKGWQCIGYAGNLYALPTSIAGGHSITLINTGSGSTVFKQNGGEVYPTVYAEYNGVFGFRPSGYGYWSVDAAGLGDAGYLVNPSNIQISFTLS